MKKRLQILIGCLFIPCAAFSAIKPEAFQPVSSPKLQPLPTSSSEKTITPSYGPLPQHNVDVVLDAEFLYFFSAVDNLPYVTISEVRPFQVDFDPESGILLPIETKDFDWNWHSGVRLGWGVVTNHDGWGVKLDWTYFYNSGTNSIAVPPFIETSVGIEQNPLGTLTLSSPWGYEPNTLPGLSTNQFQSISSRWSLLFNQFDFTLGRKFWISERLTLNPYGGVRGHFSRLHMNTRSYFNGLLFEGFPNNITGISNEHTRLKQKFWAVGLLAGVDTGWHITPMWSVFGKASASLVYGSYSIQKRLTASLVSDDPLHEEDFNVAQAYRHDDIFALQPVLDLAIGIRWESTLSEGSYRLLFDLGWENHIWWNFNRLERLSPIASSYGNLTLFGLVVRGQFEF